MEKKENRTSSSLQNPTESPLIRGTGRKAFTLVELIIVITILAILATIAFISFQGYAKDSRDAVRVSDLASASKGLTIFFTKSGVYPETESGITISASGNTLAMQGTLGASVVRAINMNQVPRDPVDQTNYTYSTNAQKTKYQLMTYTENSSLASLLPESYALDLTDRGVQMRGDELGVLLNTDSSLPTQDINAYTGTETYKIVFDSKTTLEGSGNLLFSQFYNMRDDLLRQKEIAKLDDSLVGYWDMETLTGDLLRDWGKYENNGTCYNGGTSGKCGEVGPKIVSGEGKTGKAMSFDGVDDWIDIGNASGFDDQNGTIIVSYKLDTLPTVRNKHQVLWSNWPSDSNRLYLFMSLNTDYLSVYGKINSVVKTEIYSDINVTTNRFFNVSFKYNNKKIYTYADGNKLQVSNGNNDYDSPEVNALKIGTHIYTLSCFDGLIDEVRIYNRALSDVEIQALYSATK